MSASARDSLVSNPYTQKAIAQVRRHRKWLYALLALVLVFGLLGYFWLPGFAKGKVEELLSAKLHRPVTVERIEVKPYSLEVTVHGFRIGERVAAGEMSPSEEGKALFKFESLYVNLSSTSIARAAPVITAVTLKAPQIHLSRDKNGRLSIADLIEEFSQQPESEGKAKFSVSNIQIEGGAFAFDDQLKQGTQKISDIKLGVPFVASFESSEEVWVQPHFSARINDGSLIEMQGKVRPFADLREAGLEVKLDGLDLTGVDQYAPELGGIKLVKGLLDTDLEIVFKQASEQAAQILISGDIALRNLDVDNKSAVPWRVNGERIVLKLRDFDPMLQKPITAQLDAANVRFKQGDKPELLINSLALSDVQADIAASKAAFKLAAIFNDKGSLNAHGNVGWAPLNVSLEVAAKEVDVVALQGFAMNYPAIVMTRGALTFDGKINAAGTPLNVAVIGDARIADFNLLDKANKDDLLRWRSLELNGMDITTAPLKVNIKSIVESDFFARVTIMPDGSLRLRDVMATGKEGADIKVAEKKAEESVDKEVEKVGKATVVTAKAAEEKASLPISIDEVILKNGNVIFNDLFIKPNYRANLTQLSGKIGPLTPGKPGQVAVIGSINRSAPLEIKGKLDPFGKALYLDITAKAKGIDMPSFSPYSTRYVGYAIAKGKLSVDLNYFIEKGVLRAENKIFLDQFTLGEKTEVPGALDLPLGLAVSLLKNSRGEIDINLPISGSLNDPEFSIGGLVIKVFFNLLAKAVTAPFALIGSLFGDGADLSQIDFEPGYARLTPEATKALETISKAMLDRPGMKVDVVGVADLVSDAPGLRKATLERRVKAQKLAELAKQGKSGGSLNEVEVSAAEYPKYLELAYKAEKFDKPRNLIGLNKSLPPAEMERLLLDYLPAGEEQMRSLAERRGRAASEALLAKGVPTERVFMGQAKVLKEGDGQKSASRVEFALR